jgi:hypothetical protein
VHSAGSWRRLKLEMFDAFTRVELYQDLVAKYLEETRSCELRKEATTMTIQRPRRDPTLVVQMGDVKKKVSELVASSRGCRRRLGSPLSVPSSVGAVVQWAGVERNVGFQFARRSRSLSPVGGKERDADEENITWALVVLVQDADAAGN